MRGAAAITRHADIRWTKQHEFTGLATRGLDHIGDLTYALYMFVETIGGPKKVIYIGIAKSDYLAPGQRFLDIGCGSGGLILHAAINYGVEAVGITNSRSHFERSQAAITESSLQGRVRVIYGDFTEIEGEFDRIASVGMLEHVPPKQYAVYFGTIKRILSRQGWALVHAIGLNASDNRNDPFIQKYIFPGSDTPRLSAMSTEIETNDMAIIDVENICRHYAVTTTRWLEAFRRNSNSLDPERYDQMFKRMWEYYLCIGVAAADGMAGDYRFQSLPTVGRVTDKQPLEEDCDCRAVELCSKYMSRSSA